MLKLTRRPFERIILQLPDGRQIRVQVTNLRRTQAIIGIEAPDDVRILREEIAECHDESPELPVQFGS